MPVITSFQPSTILYAANLNSSYANCANINGDAFLGTVSFPQANANNISDNGSGTLNVTSSGSTVNVISNLIVTGNLTVLGSASHSNSSNSVSNIVTANNVIVSVGLLVAGINVGAELANVYNAANSAFLEANSFQGYINSAYTTANAAFLEANSLTASITFASGTANAAFLEANSFQSVINSAFSTANSANTTAINAYNNATAAFAEANSFQSVINSAFATANVAFSAYANANAALAEANSFQGFINSAYSTANAAFAEANLANSIAASAFPLSGGTVSGNVIIDGTLTVQNSAALQEKSITTRTNSGNVYLTLAGSGTFLTLNNSSTTTVVIANNLPVGYSIDLINLGTGIVYINANTNVVMVGPNHPIANTMVQNTRVQIVSYASNTFFINPLTANGSGNSGGSGITDVTTTYTTSGTISLSDTWSVINNSSCTTIMTVANATAVTQLQINNIGSNDSIVMFQNYYGASGNVILTTQSALTVRWSETLSMWITI